MVMCLQHKGVRMWVLFALYVIQVRTFVFQLDSMSQVRLCWLDDLLSCGDRWIPQGGTCIPHDFLCMDESRAEAVSVLSVVGF